MATLTTIWKLALVCLVLLVVLETIDVEARRGGGGSRGSSRSFGRRSYNRRSYGRTTSRRSYSNVRLSGRIKGSSRYNSGNWKAAAVGGAIFGFGTYALMSNRWGPSYRNRMPTICTNNLELRPNSTVKKGHFICARQVWTELYCCGPKNAEYCCTKLEAQKYYSDHHKGSSGFSVGGIIGIIIAAIVVAACVFICCKRKHSQGEVIRKAETVNQNHPQAIPLNQPYAAPSPAPVPQQYPMTPPPAYASTGGYGDAAPGGLPYGPPPHTMPQPPYDMGKPPMPGPGLDASAPYPPSYGGAPYPAPQPPYPVDPQQPPYPPPGGMYPPGQPYPPGQYNNSPYPPPS